MEEQHVREAQVGLTEKKKEKTIFNNKIVLASLGILAFIWLLALTNLGVALFKIPQAQLPVFQADLFRIAIVLTIVFITALIFIFYLKDKTTDLKQQEGNAIIVVDSHTQYPVIRTIAKLHHGLQLGNVVYEAPPMQFTEAGSVPVSRFFEFENLYNGNVVSHSLWKQDYVRKITTHLVVRDFVGLNKPNKFRHGEYREEPFRSIATTTASKKGKDLSQAKTFEEHEEEGSATED